MYVSIDLGGTNTRIASSKDLENIIEVEKFSTQETLEEQREKITDAVLEVSNDEQIESICIGVPGIIDKKHNKFGHIVNFNHLNGLEYKELFRPDLNCSNFIAENDAALAGLGEAIFGAGKEYQTVVYLTISTGVGGVRIANNKLDLTQKFSEPGHHIIDVGGPIDTKVHLHGTFEAYVSGEAFERNYGVSPEDCDNQEVWEDYGQKLSHGLINICAFWAPDIVIMGGGVSNKYDRFIESLETNFKYQDFFEYPEVTQVALGDDAGLFGGIGFNKASAGELMRETPVGNGHLLINHNTHGDVRDIFYPNVGKENHSQETKCPLYFQIEDDLIALADSRVEKRIRYEHLSLISDIDAECSKYDFKFKLKETVHPKKNIYIKEITANKESLFYWNVHLQINSHGFGNTILYEPQLQTFLYYKDNVWFALGVYNGDFEPEYYNMGKDNLMEKLGESPTNAIQGDVNCVMGVKVKPDEPAYFYLIASDNFENIRRSVRNFKLKTTNFKNTFEQSHKHWDDVLSTCKTTVGECKKNPKGLSDEILDEYLQSILILQTNINHNGAIVAGNDSSNLHMNQDTYQYCWPRDGAYVAKALDSAGYLDYSHLYYNEFIGKHVHPIDEGWIWHKYNIDGTYSSSWHSFVNYATGEYQIPMQEDEIGIILWSFAKHRSHCEEDEISWFEGGLRKAADFMVKYTDDRGLPLPSYDLWEEEYSIFSYTCATVYAGLMATAEIASEFGDASSSKVYLDAAQKMKEATEKYLYSEELGRFFRDLETHGGKEVQDTRIDASMFALWYYDMFDVFDPKIESTMKQYKEELWVKDGIGGVCRYRDDTYFTKQGQPPNPWIICTLWLAYWHIKRKEKEEALEIIEWVMDHIPESGVMSEQLDSITGEPVSVGPLTWSHATFIDVINEFIETF